MGQYNEVFVAFDVAKKKHAIAIAEGGRAGEVRLLGDVENSPLPIERMIKRLAERYERLHFCFEAGPTGYGLYRQIQALGHDCMVVAPALIPKRSGERIKTSRRDAVRLARLHRAGELTGVWAPDAAHEAVRDLVRAREAAADDLRRKREQLLPSCCDTTGFTVEAAIWTLAHRRWLADQKFEHAAQLIVFQEGIDAIEDALQRLRRLEKQLAFIVPDWSMAPVLEAYQAMRGASFLVAVTFAAEIGDVRRFDTPRQLMSFLCLVPAETSTGDTIRRKGLTLAGNWRARRALVEAEPGLSLSRTSQRHLEGPPGRTAKARARHRLEGAGPTMRPVSLSQRDRQEAFDRRGCDCSRDGCGPLGYRKGGRTSVTVLAAAQSREWSTQVGNSRR
jgi:transposase